MLLWLNGIFLQEIMFSSSLDISLNLLGFDYVFVSILNNARHSSLYVRSLVARSGTKVEEKEEEEEDFSSQKCV